MWNYNFETLQKIGLDERMVVSGRTTWREKHKSLLKKQIEMRTIESPYNDKLVEYKVKDKKEIFSIFLLFFSGFSASDAVCKLVDKYYREHKVSMDKVLKGVTKGEYPEYVRVLTYSSCLLLLLPKRVLTTLFLYGMYLLNENLHEILLPYVDEYGLAILENQIHVDVPTHICILDTSRENNHRSMSLDGIRAILKWFSIVEGDEWIASIFIDGLYQELETPVVEELEKYLDSGEYDKVALTDDDFEIDVTLKKELAVSCMEEMYSIPKLEQSYFSCSQPELLYWTKKRSDMGYGVKVDSKLINFLYILHWISNYQSHILTSTAEYVSYAMEDNAVTVKEIEYVPQQVRFDSDIQKIETLEKLLADKQKIINDFEIIKLREQNNLQEQLASLEEENRYLKEQLSCEEQLKELEEESQDNTDVSYEDMVRALQSRNLVFVGGHENWIARMKRILPEVKFASRKLHDIPQLSSSVEALFFKFDQSSHKAYYKAKSMCKACDVPFYYISGTDVEECIRQIYVQLCYKK